MNERPPDDLQPWVEAFSGRLDEAIEDEAPPADLAAVLERARELSASVPEDETIEAEGEEQTPAAIAEALTPFVLAYRGQLNARVGDVAMPPRPGGHSQTPMRVTLWIAGGALAAAMLLVWVVGELRGSDRAVAQDGPGVQAVDAVRESNAGGSAKTRVEPVVKRPRKVAPKREVVPIEEPIAEVPEEPEAVVEPDPEPKQTLGERIDELDARARRKWRAGDRESAERIFRKIIAIGGRRRAVQVAYGDLFALVRQQGNDPSSLWRAYLKRFPKGRFAADAKAGLCRRASGQARNDCWAEYRERFPDGNHQGRP